MPNFYNVDLNDVTEQQIREAVIEDGGHLMGFGYGLNCPGKIKSQVTGWDIQLVDRRGMGNHGAFVAIPTTRANYKFAREAALAILRKMADEAEENGTINERGNFAVMILPYLFSPLNDRRGTFLFKDDKWAYFAHSVANYLNVGNDTFRVWVRPVSDPEGFEQRRQIAVKRNTFVTEKQLAIAKIIAIANGHSWKSEWSPNSDNSISQLDAEMAGANFELRAVDYRPHNILLHGWEIGYDHVSVTLEGGTKVHFSTSSAWSLENGYHGFQIEAGDAKAITSAVEGVRAIIERILLALGVSLPNPILTDAGWAEVACPDPITFNSIRVK